MLYLWVLPLLLLAAESAAGQPAYYKRERHVFTLNYLSDLSLQVKQLSSIESAALKPDAEALESTVIYQPYYQREFQITALVDGKNVRDYQLYNRHAAGGDVFFSGNKIHRVLFSEEQRKVGKKQKILYSGMYDDVALFPKISIPAVDSLSLFEIEINHPETVTLSFHPAFFFDSLAYTVEQGRKKTTLRINAARTRPADDFEMSEQAAYAEVLTTIYHRGAIANASTEADFVRWYQGNPKLNVPLDINGLQLAKELAGRAASPEDKADSLFKWVQKSIRYIADMSGGHSFYPHDPNTVLSNRYGDCKDRAYLLYRMGEAVGLPVYMALVHTSSLSDWPVVHVHNYNHVINVMRLPGDSLRLYDPTETYSNPNRLASNLAGKNLLILDPARAEQIKVPPAVAFETMQVRIRVHEDSLDSGRAEVELRGSLVNNFEQVYNTAPATAGVYAVNTLSAAIQKAGFSDAKLVKRSAQAITLAMQVNLKAFFVQSQAGLYAPKIPFLTFPQGIQNELRQPGPLYLQVPDNIELEIDMTQSKPALFNDSWTRDSGTVRYSSAAGSTASGVQLSYRFSLAKKNWRTHDKAENGSFIKDWLINKNKLYKLK